MESNLAIRFLFVLSIIFSSQAFAEQKSKELDAIKNFHFVSSQLASAGSLSLEQYQPINKYGFKHVINLIPGMQLKEQRHVESLGLSYQQIPVDWDNPTIEDFQRFVKLMKQYGDDKVFVHCELNWRASTFVYLYRVTQQNISSEIALKDLLAIWTPHDGWDPYIEEVIESYH